MCYMLVNERRREERGKKCHYRTIGTESYSRAFVFDTQRQSTQLSNEKKIKTLHQPFSSAHDFWVGSTRNTDTILQYFKNIQTLNGISHSTIVFVLYKKCVHNSIDCYEFRISKIFFLCIIQQFQCDFLCFSFFYR